MISDEERREEARRLRALDHVVTNCDTIESGVNKFIKAVYGDRPYSPIECSTRNLCGLAMTLADLIDMPKAKRDDAGNYWRCGHCGAFSRKDAVTNCFGVIPSRCCGNCGREWER